MLKKKQSPYLNEKLLLGLLNETDANIDNLSVIYKGVRIFTYRKENDDLLVDIRSITHSVISMLIGIAIEKGIIQSQRIPVSHFFPSAPKDLKIEDLLLMKSGFDIEDSEVNQCFIKSVNWIDDILKIERSGDKDFLYKGVDYHLLSGILTKATGKNAARFAERHLFTPLGITQFVWLEDLQGHSVGSMGLKLTHSGLEKLGMLYLKKGSWDGKRIVSSRWVNRSTSPRVDTHLPYGFYGYGFWVKDYGDLRTYRAQVANGQQILNCPEKDLSLVITTNSHVTIQNELDELTRAVLDEVN